MIAGDIHNLNHFSPDESVKDSRDEILELSADVAILGGGLGGVAAALSLAKENRTVILTEETDWIGGQISQQGVPPDEHRWIETTGATQTYRDFRNAIRNYYRRNYPLKEKLKQDPFLNPGSGGVSRICHEPRVAVAVLTEFLAPFISNGKIKLLLNHKAISASTTKDKVTQVEVINDITKTKKLLRAAYFLDATELGDLLPMTGTEFVTGTESKKQTGELHASEKGDPNNVQAFTMCMAIDYVPGGNHIIQKPPQYEFWRNFTPQLTPAWPGKLLDLHYSTPKTLVPKQLAFDPSGRNYAGTLNLWNYRKIINSKNFDEDFYPGDITVVNWPQNDYLLGNLIGASRKDFEKHIAASQQLSLSLLYWLQTEVKRPDGGKGWPGLRLRKDIMGTENGLAKFPYIRESRRIKAKFTILEQHVGAENRLITAMENEDNTTAAWFNDSVGIGYYHIDLHPSTSGNNYIDFPSLRFQIPLGALLPVRMKNLLPVNKNIGTTHITNGCYRLHPVEWSIGEAVGWVIGYSLNNRTTPLEIWSQNNLLKNFQEYIRKRGVETEWPKGIK